MDSTVSSSWLPIFTRFAKATRHQTVVVLKCELTNLISELDLTHDMKGPAGIGQQTSTEMKLGKTLCNILGPSCTSREVVFMNEVRQIVCSFFGSTHDFAWGHLNQRLEEIAIAGILDEYHGADVDLVPQPLDSAPGNVHHGSLVKSKRRGNSDERAVPVSASASCSGSADESQHSSFDCQSSSSSKTNRKRTIDYDSDSDLGLQYQRRFGGHSWTGLVDVIMQKEVELEEEKHKGKLKDEIIDSLRKNETFTTTNQACKGGYCKREMQYDK